MEEGVRKMGYNEFSLLSLSCSDYLSLPAVGLEIKNRLKHENVTLSLPRYPILLWIFDTNFFLPKTLKNQISYLLALLNGFGALNFVCILQIKWNCTTVHLLRPLCTTFAQSARRSFRREHRQHRRRPQEGVPDVRPRGGHPAHARHHQQGAHQ